ncbi:unnamed protein product [Symbiodinium natans]|uniref:Uncharacterized protein n=1 Tax=Symbiodinium natans TaxID=878477 RepID=A0A812UBM3_9DINO|nr:unnamed protein product [Symbiodinium natans]
MLNYLQKNWEPAPAVLFLETFTGNAMHIMGRVSEKPDACSFAGRDLQTTDPFYPVLAALQIPMVSYADMACAMPALGRGSKSKNNVPFLYTYVSEADHHYGCGVHFIQAQSIHVFLHKLLHDSCIEGYQATLSTAAAEDAAMQQLQAQNLSQVERCQTDLQSFLSYLDHRGFPALVGPSSTWLFGADSRAKYGWIANWKPQGNQTGNQTDAPGLPQSPKRGAATHYAQFDDLPATDIVFIIHLKIGGVLVEYLSTYNNIGSASCQIEDLSGRIISPVSRLNGLWDKHMSMSSQATFFANMTQLARDSKGIAAFRPLLPKAVACRSSHVAREESLERRHFGGFCKHAPVSVVRLRMEGLRVSDAVRSTRSKDLLSTVADSAAAASASAAFGSAVTSSAVTSSAATVSDSTTTTSTNWPAQTTGTGGSVDAEAGACPPQAPESFLWGWDQACHLGATDEACEVFLASKMFPNVSHLLAVSTRVADRSYQPRVARLKLRLSQAAKEKRPFRIIVIGPSNTIGRGCSGHGRGNAKGLRWSDALQNLSNYTRSPLQMEVINEALGATTFYNIWSQQLGKHSKDSYVDLVAVDYTLTAADKLVNSRAVLAMLTYLQRWKPPPAVLFLETFTGNAIHIMGHVSEKPDACSFAGANLRTTDPLFPALAALQIPMVSYADVACDMPALGRSSASRSKVPFLYTYANEDAHHYGCGVHFIQAQSVHAFLHKLLRDSCIEGDQATLSGAAAEDAALQQLQANSLSQVERCQTELQSYMSYLDHRGFPALVGADSTWQFGADSRAKYGWIANWKPQGNETGNVTDAPRLPMRAKPVAATHYAQFDDLPATDIVFIIHLGIGGVLVEYLSTYNNIGSASCQVEDLSGRIISQVSRLNGLWDKHMSMSSQAVFFANMTQLARDSKGTAAFRCRSEGKKFKILSISTC